MEVWNEKRVYARSERKCCSHAVLATLKRKLIIGRIRAADNENETIMDLSYVQENQSLEPTKYLTAFTVAISLRFCLEWCPIKIMESRRIL